MLEFRPKEYAELKEAGTLTKTLYNRARKMAAEVDSLVASGFTEEEAQQMTRGEYLFPAPEPDVIERLEAEQ